MELLMWACIVVFIVSIIGFFILRAMTFVSNGRVSADEKTINDLGIKRKDD